MFNLIIYLAGSIMTLVCIILCIILFFRYKSKDAFGHRRVLENGTKEKPWSLGTWIAGVFVAGTGVALMYAPVDLLGYVNNGLNPKESVLMMTLLNGAPVWALYSIMGLWYMKHMDSKVGKLAAMLSTILGMSISLWTGTNTIANFLGYDFGGLKFVIAGIMVGVAILSAKFKLLKNISRIAFLVFIIAFLVLISTPLDSISLHPISGSITSEFYKQYFTGSTTASWIFWFLSWTPTVARWLAHISKGRTMKEYIAGTMLLPTGLALVWMSISWMYQDVILSFNIRSNPIMLIPCIIFIISGTLFMIGTLDSDCIVFTEDLSELSRNRINPRSAIPYYGLFVLSVFCLFISGIIKNPFAFNEYSSLVFIPLMVWSINEGFNKKNKTKSISNKR